MFNSKCLAYKIGPTGPVGPQGPTGSTSYTANSAIYDGGNYNIHDKLVYFEQRDTLKSSIFWCSSNYIGNKSYPSPTKIDSCTLPKGVYLICCMYKSQSAGASYADVVINGSGFEESPGYSSHSAATLFKESNPSNHMSTANSVRVLDTYSNGETMASLYFQTNNATIYSYLWFIIRLS